MKVNEIRDRVVELSFHGAGPDGEANARALTWLNSAYQQLLDELLPYAPPLWQRMEMPTVAANGTVTLSQPVHALLKVLVGSEELPITDALSAVGGQPGVYVFNDGTGKTLLAKAATGKVLTVVYLPEVADLVEGGDETTVLIPRTQHSGLVWGGLVWSALYERGFTSAANLAVYQALWQEARQRVRLLMLGERGVSKMANQTGKGAPCSTVDRW